MRLRRFPYERRNVYAVFIGHNIRRHRIYSIISPETFRQDPFRTFQGYRLPEGSPSFDLREIDLLLLLAETSCYNRDPHFIADVGVYDRAEYEMHVLMGRVIDIGNGFLNIIEG